MNYLYGLLEDDDRAKRLAREMGHTYSGPANTGSPLLADSIEYAKNLRGNVETGLRNQLARALTMGANDSPQLAGLLGIQPSMRDASQAGYEFFSANPVNPEALLSMGMPLAGITKGAKSGLIGGGRPGVPFFETYDDAQAYIAQRAKELGGLKKYTSTQEYGELYPRIAELQKQKNVVSAAESMKQLSVSGYKIGDKVKTTYGSMLSGFNDASGTIVDKGGFPYVKIDGGPITVSRKGRLSETTMVPWSKQWAK